MLRCAAKATRTLLQTRTTVWLLSGVLMFAVSGCAQLQRLISNGASAPDVTQRDTLESAAFDADESRNAAAGGARPYGRGKVNDPTPETGPDTTGDSISFAELTRAGKMDGLRRSPDAQSDDADDGQPSVVNLGLAWRLALLNDPTYQAALSQRAAAQTERAQGRAALLPQLRASYYRGRVRGSRTLPDVQGIQHTSDLRYDSTNASIQLQQPVLNYGRVAEYRRGAALADEGVARFAVQRNETGVRLATAYFRVLLAQGRLQLQRALVTSLASRVKTLEAQYRLSESTRTDVEETRARLAVARADTLSAEDELRVARRELTLMVGRTPDSLASLKTDFPLPPLAPATLVQWLDHARQRSPQIELARKILATADTEVDTATSRFLPTLDLIASYAHADSEDLTLLSQTSNTFVVGLQLNIPLFTGGYNTAERSKASAERRLAQSEYDAAIEQVQAEIIRQFTRVDGGADRIRALEEAEASAALSLEAASKSFEYGIGSNLDVLRTEDTLHQTRHELLTARLDYLIARVKLAATTDTLHETIFDNINMQFLHAGAIESAP